MDIKFYKIVDDDDFECGTTYGCFSTYEKAAEFMKQFNGLDGFGICEESLKIVECTLKLDTVDDWVKELIIHGRMQKKKFEGES